MSTNVGGVPEVLPHDMIYLSNPDEYSIQEKLEQAIERVDNIPSFEYHEQVKAMYSWSKVASKTEVVYQTVLDKPHNSLGDRIKTIMSSGPVTGFINAVVILIFIIVLVFCEYFIPRHSIDIAEEFDVRKYKKGMFFFI